MPILGNTTGNTIGSNSGTGSISLNNTNTSHIISYGIGSNAASSTVNISNNSIGSITLNSSSVDYVHNFTGIQVSNGTTVTIDKNTIGSTTTTNSINATNASTSPSGQYVKGIVNSSAATITLSNNTIANMNNNAAGLGEVLGIESTNGVNTIKETICIILRFHPATVLQQPIQ